MLFQRSSDGKPKALPNTLDDCKGPRELPEHLFFTANKLRGVRRTLMVKQNVKAAQFPTYA
jgi:hypothetical protein